MGGTRYEQAEPLGFLTGARSALVVLCALFLGLAAGVVYFSRAKASGNGDRPRSATPKSHAIATP